MTKGKITNNKPGRIYKKHNHKKVNEWKRDNYQKIKAEWNDPYTAILCEDEMNLSTQTTFQKILLLWDGPGTHKGSEVTNFLKEDGNIEVIYFPSYSPEENPQEHIWNTGREHVTHNNFIPNVEKTANDFVEYLNRTKFPYKLLGFSAKS